MDDQGGQGPALAAEQRAGPARRGRAMRGRAVQATSRRAQTAGAATGSGRGGASGRGRGRKRARESDPPPPPPPAEDEESEEKREEQEPEGSSSSEEEGSGDANGNSEAAAIAAVAAIEGQAPQQQPPPPVPQLSVREQTLQLLRGMGLPGDRAEQALAEAEENAEAPFTDPIAWAEEAQILLACRVEFEEERDQLAEAMHVSLQEEQERKQAEVPLLERTDEDIRQEFCDSQLLHQLALHASLGSLLSPPLREQVLEWLQLEKRCKKWYCIASHYFEAAARQLAALLGDADASSSAAQAGAPAAVPAAVPAAAPAAKGGGVAGAASAAAGSGQAAAAAAAASGSGRPGATAAGAAGAAAEPPPIGEDMAAVLAAELFERRAEVERAVFSMPADGGSSAAVPQLFSEAVPPGAQVQAVEDLISDSEDDEGPGGGQGQGQQRAGAGGAMQQQQEQQQEQQQQVAAG